MGGRGLRWLAVLCGVAVLALACASDVPAHTGTPAGRMATLTGDTTSVRDIQVDGVTRSYLLVVPRASHGRLPLVVVLHGISIIVQQEAVRTGFLPLAASGRAIVAYPIGTDESWNAGDGCCGGALGAGADDSAFIADVAGDVSRQAAVDPDRLYLVGYSNGGKMAFREVCDHPALFAAVATYGAVPLAACMNPSRPPVPVLIAAGSDDTDINATHPGKSATQVVVDAATAFRVRDACSAQAETSRIAPAPVPVTLTEWTDCAQGTAVASVIYQGLPHYWPTSVQTPVPFSTPVGPAAAAATLMWRFLAGHHAAQRR